MMATGCTFIVVLIVQCLLATVTDVLTTDPCPADIERKEKVVTMCENGVVTEDTTDGGISVDSVVLRVAKQMDDCVCSIQIKYQVSNESTFYMKKYDDRTGFAPTVANCGLEIDVTSSDPTETLEPITCLQHKKRMFASPDLYLVHLTTRKTNDSFINGYCLQFFRNSTDSTPATLSITCYDSSQHQNIVSTAETTYPLSTNIYIVSTAETTYPSSTNEQHTTMSTISDDTNPTDINSSNISTASYSNESNTHLENKKDMHLENNNQEIFIISGASVGGGLFICIIVVAVSCKCRKSKNDQQKRTPQTNNDNEDRDSYGLKDNILYVSSDDINAFVGNYAYVDSNINTTDEEIDKDNTLDIAKPKPTVKSKPSKSGVDNINVVYAVVNKANKEQTSGASLVDSNNEYAVVNKTGVQ